MYSKNFVNILYLLLIFFLENIGIKIRLKMVRHCGNMVKC